MAKFSDLIAVNGSAAQIGLLQRAAEARSLGDDFYRGVLEMLAAATYITDSNGHTTFFNEAAAALWGCRPKLGKSEWCGSWKLFWPDGRRLLHGECPMALALMGDRAVRGMEVVAERPDSGRMPFLPLPTPLHDSSAALWGR